MDGFDHRGTVAARLLDGEYSSSNNVEISASAARTGQYGLRIHAGANDSGLRWRPHASKDAIGYGHTFGVSRLPDDDRSAAITQILTAEGDVLATTLLTPTGAISCRLGGRLGTLRGISQAEVILPGSDQHIEHAWIDGALEIRVDGTTCLNVPDVGYSGPIGQTMFGGCYGYPKTGAILLYYNLDDLYVWDTVGSDVNTFVGDQGVYTRLVDADGTIVEWLGTQPGDLYPLIDNVPPNDASYIYATETEAKASFGVSDYPTNLIAVTATQVSSRMWKTAPGDAKVALGVASGSSEEIADAHALSANPRWYRNVFEKNPATGLPWLVGDLNNADAIIERTE